MAEKAAPPHGSWYADGLRFACTQCGNCCTGPPGYVWFDDAEADAMARYLGLGADAFRRQYAKRDNGRWTLNEIRKGPDEYDCVFLRRDEQGRALCRVYSVRPTQCRTWPFWPANLRSRRAWGAAAKHCPGTEQGLAGGGNFYPVEQVRVIVAENPNGL
jgi:Fe-S-cluster containining protein